MRSSTFVNWDVELGLWDLPNNMLVPMPSSRIGKIEVKVTRL